MTSKIEDFTIEDFIKDIKQRLVELEAQLEKKSKPWRPEKGAGYWYLAGEHVACLGSYGGSPWDKINLLTGNYFRSEEQVKLYVKILTRIVELNGDWVPDWQNRIQKKRYFYYDHVNNKAKCFYHETHEENNLCMSKETADKILEEFTQEELRVLFPGAR